MSEILIDDFINSINKIEPQEGARERMLANIRQKSQKKKVVSFATIAKIVIPVAAGLIIALVGSMVIPNITDTKKSTKQEEETNATLDVVADGEFEYFRIIWQKDDITYSLVNTDNKKSHTTL